MERKCMRIYFLIENIYLVV
jgi:serine/threonine protein kinase